MSDYPLRDCHILVIEDEYLLAEDLCSELAAAGAIIIGPVGTVAAAMGLIPAESRIDGAILDINLHGEMVFPAADLLMARSVPFVFTTGYDDSLIPPRFSQVLRCEKPVNVSRLAQAIGGVVHASRANSS